MEAERNLTDPDVGAAAVTTRRSHRLELEGDLEFTAENGHRIALSAHGSNVRLELGPVPGQRTTLRLLRSSVTLVRRLSRVLQNRSLTLVITREGEPLIELGTGVTGQAVARLFGMSRVRFYRRGFASTPRSR